MSVKIEIFGDNAQLALVELQRFASGLASSGESVREKAEAQAQVVAEASAPVYDPSRDTIQETPAPEAEKPKPRGRPKKETPPPAAPVPTPAEVQAQDDADEAAESEAAAEPPADDAPVTYTREDLRKALGTYGSTYGMDAAMADMPKLLGFANVTATPDEHVTKAVLNVLAAIDSDPYGRAAP